MTNITENHSRLHKIGRQIILHKDCLGAMPPIAEQGETRASPTNQASEWAIGERSSSSDQHCCSFKAKAHGHGTEKIKTNVALISVKVTWSTLPSGFDNDNFLSL